MATKTRRNTDKQPGRGRRGNAPAVDRGLVRRPESAARPVASRRLLDAARRALGVASDDAAIRTALEAVVARERQAQGILRLAALGPVDASRVD